VVTAALVVLVPSRGRPRNVTRLVRACAETCTLDTVLHFGFDDDDPAFTENLKAADGCLTTIQERMGLAPWTNHLAGLHPDAAYLASLGDDMVPVTYGWDERLVDAQKDMGGGYCYPDDKRRSDIPEAVVIDARIVRALGWFSPPGLDHWYQDMAWRDLGSLTGRLRYCPDVVIEHRHPNVPGGDPSDATYTEAAGSFAADMAVYQKWRLKSMRRDAGTVAACLA